MIVKLQPEELSGRLMIDDKKVTTMTEISSIEELKNLIVTAKFVYSDILLYKGSIDDLLTVTLTPEQKAKLMVYQAINPDLYDIETLSRLQGYTILGMTSSDYHNMEQLYKVNTIYPNIRFCGGYFCKLDGVKIGLIEDKSKEVVFNNKYSISDEVIDLFELDNRGIEYEFTAKVVKEKQSKSSVERQSKAKTKAMPKCVVAAGMDCF